MKHLNLLKSFLLLCALVVGSSSVWAAEKTYKLVTSTSELVAGCNYLIVTVEFSNASDPVVDASYYTVGPKNSNTNRKAIEVTVSNSMVTTDIASSSEDTSLPREFELKTSAVEGRWNFYSNAESGYLNGGYKRNNHLKIGDLISGKSSAADGNWSISISESGVATIKNQTSWQIAMNPNFQGQKGSKTFPNPLMASYGTNLSNYTSVCLYKEVATASISANKEWITYTSKYALDFSSDIDGLEGAYTITSHSAGATTLTATKMTGTVKAGTGLLLHAAAVDTEDAQVIAIPVAASGDEQTDNMLVGVTAATTVNPTDGTKTNLGLKSGTFVPYSAAGTLAAGKAYLQIPTADMPSNGSKLTIIFDDDETTGIDSIHNSWLSQAAKPSAQFIIHNDTPMFNLSGQRVSESYKGIVIVNGKKYIRK